MFAANSVPCRDVVSSQVRNDVVYLGRIVFGSVTDAQTGVVLPFSPLRPDPYGRLFMR